MKTNDKGSQRVAGDCPSILTIMIKPIILSRTSMNNNSDLTPLLKDDAPQPKAQSKRLRNERRKKIINYFHNKEKDC